MASVGTARRLRILFGVVVGSVAISMAYGALAATVAGNPALEGVGIGAIRGFTISLVVGALELFGTRTRIGRRLEQAPFLVTFATKTLIYGSIIVATEAVNLGARLVTGSASDRLFGSAVAPLSLGFAFLGTVFFLFVVQIGRLVGWGPLGLILTGRYHRPRAEERFFLFVDVAGSTTIAERLGAAATHRFLARVFAIAGEAVDDHHGRVYQYVGDEVVVTWSLERGRVAGRPLGCFFAIETALAQAAAEFVRDFDVVPRLRGALHAGSVIAGEVGDSKREIVFHGDVMNTAARLEDVTREVGRRFVASDDAIARLEGRDRFVVEDLGPRTLRGRATPVRVYAVDSKDVSPPS